MTKIARGVGRTLPPRETCTAQRRNGSFCDSHAMAGAPFPICARHAIRVFEFIADELKSRTTTAGALDALRTFTANHATNVKRAPFNPQPECVYYVQVGPHIKIGHTMHLKARMEAYPRTARLLAVEYGSVTLEKQRHRQFGEDRETGREWFRASQALMQHIEELAEANELPVTCLSRRTTANAR